MALIAIQVSRFDQIHTALTTWFDRTQTTLPHLFHFVCHQSQSIWKPISSLKASLITSTAMMRNVHHSDTVCPLMIWVRWPLKWLLKCGTNKCTENHNAMTISKWRQCRLSTTHSVRQKLLVHSVCFALGIDPNYETDESQTILLSDSMDNSLWKGHFNYGHNAFKNNYGNGNCNGNGIGHESFETELCDIGTPSIPSDLEMAPIPIMPGMKSHLDGNDSGSDLEMAPIPTQMSMSGMKSRINKTAFSNNIGNNGVSTNQSNKLSNIQLNRSRQSMRSVFELKEDDKPIMAMPPLGGCKTMPPNTHFVRDLYVFGLLLKCLFWTTFSKDVTSKCQHFATFYLKMTTLPRIYFKMPTFPRIHFKMPTFPRIYLQMMTFQDSTSQSLDINVFTYYLVHLLTSLLFTSPQKSKHLLLSLKLFQKSYTSLHSTYLLIMSPKSHFQNWQRIETRTTTPITRFPISTSK